MVASAFFKGFEKAAYDYNYEVQQQEEYAKKVAPKTPMPVSKSMALGATGLAPLGAIGGAVIGGVGGRKVPQVGALRGAGKMGILGLLGGAAVGGLAGLVGAIGERTDIAEQKKIMTMDPWARREYLRSKARRAEMDEQVSRQEWKEYLHGERRHQETLRAIRGK